MVDTEDSKSFAPKACGFKSRPGYLLTAVEVGTVLLLPAKHCPGF